MKRFRIVMTGPLPPAVGGMTSVIMALKASSLSQHADIELFETGKVTPEGRPLWLGIKTRLHLMVRWWNKFEGPHKPVAHIHTCDGLSYFLDGGLIVLSRLRGVPVVLHVHGARFDVFLRSLSRVLAWIAYWLARRCAMVIALSPGWQKELFLHWPAADIRVVSNGVYAERTAYAVSAPAGVPKFVFIGHLCQRKGVYVLLEAAALAREDWTVELLGGEYEPGAKARAEHDIQRLNLKSRCYLRGIVVGEEKINLLAGAQGFVLPSFHEGLPMALLETMAMGLPSVVTSAGAMAEAVRDGVDGLVVPPGDAQALADALDTLARDTALRGRMGAAAAKRWQSLYGVENMVDKLMVLYAELGR
ncbi:glycosyltransferase family 4 protein [Azohydromonas lata]|uniref:glycosyltransferase family 4 protein n=1 Tax=Azohydromonas lata TaxID=45677 RepID=UPI00147106D9|nr:glycosyltransferase family 4 protein [Azohydromonas lata]